MIRDEAYQLHDFIQKRIFGWTIVLGMNPETGRTDGRRKEAKLADRLLRESFMTGCKFPEAIEAIQRGEDPVLCWPERFQEFIRFCLWHRVPREMNEPLREKDFDEYPNQSRDWPESFKQYDKPATLADMPPLPELSGRPS